MKTSYSKIELSEIKKEKEDLLKIILKKTNTTLSELIQMSKDMYIAANLEVVTPAERKKFAKLSF